MTELMSLADSGRGAVQRELAKLAASGLVTVKRVGNQKHYQANQDSPLFEELCNIMEKTVGLKGPILDALEPLKGQINLALIYGSVAKHSDTAASDVDLMLVSDDIMLEEVFTELVPAEKLLGRKINPTLFTSAEFQARKNKKGAFLDRVLGGPTIVLMGSVDDT